MTPEIRHNAPLDRLSTFRLPARARELAIVRHEAELPEALAVDGPVLLLGDGSNTLFLDDFPGRIVLNRIAGITSEVIDNDQVRVTAGAGENWHQLVRWSLERDLWGLENLALIPGTVGAAPIQNIGAYGVELAHCLDAVRVYDRRHGRFTWLQAGDCALGYRNSRFRDQDRDRFVITAVRLMLELDGVPVLEYPSLLAELARLGHPAPHDPRTVAAAVIRIRRRKLPNPTRLPNAGSFFKNPVVTRAQAESLIADHPELPWWPEDATRVKLSAAWMIDRLNWRGRAVGDAAVHEAHALVLVNRGRARGPEVLELARRIRDSVQQRFGVTLEPEPLLVGATL